MRRIVIEPPQGDARRDRVERKLFEQLAAVRVVERAEAVIPPVRKNRLPYVLGGAGLAAAAALLVLVMTRGDGSEGTLPLPSRVVTPVGGTSQVTLPGVLIEAQSDTSVEVQHGPGGAITLVIARGAVDCDVEPRGNRPPFRVIAGDVMVEVIGTRFTVARTPVPRVDVARGKVRVTAPGGQWLVEAGQAWPDSTRTASTAVPVPPHEPDDDAHDAQDAQDARDLVRDEPEIEMAEDKVAQPVRKKPTAAATPTASAPQPTERERARDSYRIANKLEDSDPKKAAQLYRAIATDGKGMEAVALISLAEVQLKLRDPRATLAALDELARRFPNAANAEDAAWFRYEALRAMGKRDEARGAAADYLRQFPNGAYADRLRQQ